MTNNSTIRPDFKKFERLMAADLLYCLAYFFFFCAIAVTYNFYFSPFFWMPDWLGSLIAYLHIRFGLDGMALLTVVLTPLMGVGLSLFLYGYTLHPHQPKHHLDLNDIHHTEAEDKAFREQYPELYTQDAKMLEQELKRLDRNQDVFSAHPLARISTYMIVTIVVVAIVEFVLIEFIA